MGSIRWGAATGPFCACLVLLSSAACRGGGDEAPRILFNTPPPATAALSPSPAPPPGPRWPITIAAVGDIMLARTVADAVTAADPAGPFAAVRELLAAADFTVGNLECVLSEGGRPEPKGYTFRGPPLAPKGLAIAGFDAVAVANNHSLDYGREAFLESLELLRREGIVTPGGGPTEAEAYAPLVVERAGARVAFLSFAEVPDEGAYSMRAWRAGPDLPGIAWIDATMVPSIASAKGQADLVVVFFHFGVEGSAVPTERQRTVSRAAIDAGANLVIGSHPHLFQPVEEYGGGLIAYSLGNFVFDGFEGGANQSGILVVTVDQDRHLDWRIVPVSIGFDGLPRPR